MANINVIDSIMGSGKTSWAIQYMQNAPLTTKFIYVTPTLAEVQRIINAVPNRHFTEPERQHGKGTKLNSLKALMRSDENIATTHELWRSVDEEVITMLPRSNYILIMDEVIDVIHTIETMKRGDIPILLDSGSIIIKETGQVVWAKDEDLDSRYDEIRDYALAGNLYTNGDKAFVWNFSPKLFDAFQEVYLLTYLFDGQKMKYYCDLHNINYQNYSVVKEDERYKIINKAENEDRTVYRELINIWDGKLNDIGNKINALSKTRYDKSTKKQVKALKDDLYNYLRDKMRARAEQILWTTFTDYRHKIKGKGFSLDSCFTAFNTRSTNDFRHKTVLAYCINYYMHPDEMRYFVGNGLEVNQDLLALSIMLQWIFRSAVREGNPINIYIPSKRMRELLNKWLDNEI